METLRGFPRVSAETVEFVQVCPSSWKCDKCGLLVTCLWRGKQCLHGLCARCLDRLFGGRSEIKCPIDGSSLRKKEMTEEPLNQEEVLQLDVHCSNRSRGCRKTMPLKDLDSHLRECLYGVVHCPLKCGQGVTIRSLTNHMASECPRRVVNCSYCSEETVLERQELHEKGCHKRPVTCIYCQKDSLVQGELNRHLDVCLMRPRKCRLAPLGCKQTGTKTEMDEHEKSWENHMDLVLNLLMQRNNFSDSKSRNRFQEIVTIVKDLNTDNEYLQEKIEIMKQRMESLQKENDLLRSQVYKIEMAHKKDVDLLRSSLSKCQRTIEELQRNVTELQKCNDIDSGESEV